MKRVLEVIEDHIIKYPEEPQLSSLVDKIIRVDELQDLYEDNGRIFESSSEDSYDSVFLLVQLVTQREFFLVIKHFSKFSGTCIKTYLDQ